MNKTNLSSLSKLVQFSALIILLFFYIDLMRLGIRLMAVSHINDLFVLTEPNTLRLFFPLQIIAQLIDSRLMTYTIITIVLTNIPFRLLLIYPLLLLSKILHVESLHHQFYHRLLIDLVIVYVLSIPIISIAIVTAFFARTTLAAVSQVQLVGYLSVGFVLFGVALIIYRTRQHVQSKR